MVEWGGMTNMESIMAGTLNGAKLLGWDKNLGSLTPGQMADHRRRLRRSAQRYSQHAEGCVS